MWFVGRVIAGAGGQEGNGVRLNIGSDNQHVVGGGVCQCAEVGGIMMSAKVDVVVCQ